MTFEDDMNTGAPVADETPATEETPAEETHEGGEAPAAE